MDAGRVIREARERRGLQQNELALELGVQPSTVSRWENGSTAITTSRLTEVIEVCGFVARVVLERSGQELEDRISWLQAASYEERLGDDLWSVRSWSQEGFVLMGALGARLQGVPVSSSDVVGAVEPERFRTWRTWIGPWARPMVAPEGPRPDEQWFFTRGGRFLLRSRDPLPAHLEVPTRFGPLKVALLTELPEVDVDPALVERVLRRGR